VFTETRRRPLPSVYKRELAVAVPETGHWLYLAVSGQAGNLLHRSAHAPLPASAKDSQRRAFGGAFERGHKTQYGKQRSKKPEACIESEPRDHYRAAACDFKDGTRAAAFLLGGLCEPGDCRRVPCNLH